MFGKQAVGSDPLLAFNSDGDLYTAGIAFNEAKPQDSVVYVTTWAGQPAGGLPYDYQRTAIVGKGGTPSTAAGQFTDKPMMEVDRTATQFNGNVYVCWSRFVGGGRTQIFFSRSTDGGTTFSNDISLSSGKDVQGCDIAVEADGDVYVIWGTRDTPSATDREGVGFARSSNGGRTFSKPAQVGSFRRYFPFDTAARDCGDGPDLCPSQFVFARIPLEPRVTSDQSGGLPGVYVTYNAIDPATITDSGTSYDSAGPGSGLVGRGVVYVTRSLNNGQSWSAPVKVDNAGGSGHQFFPDVDALDGTLVAVWQDNRGPDYSVQRPIGNTAAATSSGATVGTFAAFSTNGTTFTLARDGVVDPTAAPVRDVRRAIRPVRRRLQLGLAGEHGPGARGIHGVDRQPRRRAWHRPSGDDTGRVRRPHVRHRDRRCRRPQHLPERGRLRPEHLRHPHSHPVAVHGVNCGKLAAEHNTLTGASLSSTDQIRPSASRSRASRSRSCRAVVGPAPYGPKAVVCVRRRPRRSDAAARTCQQCS